MQIGPRIRVGGSVGHAAQNAKNAVTKAATDVGHTVGKVADNKYAKAAVAAALLASGAGAGAGAAILGTMGAAGGALKEGGGLQDALKGGATGALTGAAAGGVGKALGGASGIGSKVKVLASGGKKLITGGGSDGKGHFGAAGDLASSFTGGGGDGRSGMIDKLLLGAGIASSAADHKRQQDMQDRASQYATDSYDSRAGLRDRGIFQALNPEKPDLSDVFSSAGNPYAVSPRAAVPTRPAVNRLMPPTLGTRSPVRRLSL